MRRSRPASGGAPRIRYLASDHPERETRTARSWAGALDADLASAQGKALGIHLLASRSEYREKSCRTSMRRSEAVAKLVFGMMQSLDGYVDGVAGRLALPPPGVALGRHFIDRV